MLVSPGPSTATSDSARMRLGNELMMSNKARMARSTGAGALAASDAEQDADDQVRSP